MSLRGRNFAGCRRTGYAGKLSLYWLQKKTQEPHTRLYFFSRMSRSAFWAVKLAVTSTLPTVETKKPRSFAANVVRWFTELTQEDPESSQYTLVFLMTVVLPVRSSMCTPRGHCLLYQLTNHLTTLKKEGIRISSAYT